MGWGKVGLKCFEYDVSGVPHVFCYASKAGDEMSTGCALPTAPPAWEEANTKVLKKSKTHLSVLRWC